MSSIAALWCVSDGELFSVSGSTGGFSAMGIPLSNGLRQVAAVTASGFCQDTLIPALTIMEVAWDHILWIPPSTSFRT